MKKREASVLLQDMLEAIQHIEDYVRGLSLHDFYEDELRQDGVVRRIEIIGEAARNLPTAFQKQYPEIPWSDIIGMRAKVAHDYFVVDLETVWETIFTDLPPLQEWIERTLGTTAKT